MAFNKLLRQIAGSVAAACLAAGVFAQSAYPTKPVKIIVPYSAGGPADIYARFIGDRLDLSDLAVPDGEIEDEEQVPTRRHDERHGSVHESRSEALSTS